MGSSGSREQEHDDSGSILHGISIGCVIRDSSLYRPAHSSICPACPAPMVAIHCHVALDDDLSFESRPDHMAHNGHLVHLVLSDSVCRFSICDHETSAEALFKLTPQILISHICVRSAATAAR